MQYLRMKIEDFDDFDNVFTEAFVDLKTAYDNKIKELEEEKDELQDQIIEQAYEIESLKEKIEELEKEMEAYAMEA